MDQAPPLADVDQLGAFLNDTVDPTSAALYLDIASGMVRAKIHQTVTRVDGDVIVLDPVNGPNVFLPELPVNSVDLVEVLIDNVWTVVDPAAYTVSTRTGSIYGFSSTRLAPNAGVQAPGVRWPFTPGSWRVTYSHGFSSPPSALVGVVLGVAARGYNSPVSVQQERIGSYQVRYAVEAGGFSPLELQALGPFTISGIR